ncbi:AfsR/SARP family transcriptional regulator [Stackebrandtia nassauensis]|uniref:Transcriptional regulator, SARP family n=1 Tax=Stackebrandtia nassauensis (strain DSM 44728 / CIP 108903 / NRRL B-16338 / NBRC 102104 / LLR-40K-21) TaxID=446470 RepID=D3Q902_STANL|nr:BTAD domain-containing putative transcriptional regulator [Stackebrandtia nassauensis]ADD40611.1 transcriptional regulator, SARP family [Stackebrandtia nassauensis DSM 44728]
MTCDIRVLGPVTVVNAGEPLDLGHRRQRTVFALLAAQVGTEVSMSWLAEQVWESRPPLRARDTLYTYLSRLRKLLSAVDEVELRRRRNGYLLAADATTVDLCRFRDLSARAARVDGPEALALRRQALGLWRGDAFADVAAPLLDTLGATLEYERFGVELEFHDALLREGRGTEALPRLRDLVDGNPLDERLAGQYLLALHASGATDDALAYFETLRNRLLADRGTEPGDRIRRLRDGLRNAEGAAAMPSAMVPRQLPGDTAVFAGRETELARLDALALHPGGESIVAISGTAGVGKTTLAVRWAHRAAKHFPDGQLYVDMRGFGPSERVVTPSEAIRGLLAGLGVPADRIPSDFDAQTALYRGHLAGRRVLVVFDNARDAAQVRPLLPGGAGCVAVVTSRNALTGLLAPDAAASLTVDTMPLPDCRALLANRIGATRGSDPAATDELIEACARLPLALSIVAARAVTDVSLTPARLSAQLRDERTRLDHLDAGDNVANVRAVFSWSYRALSPEAARLFRLLSLHPRGEISAAAAASLAGTDLAPARGALSELVDAGLLSRHGGDFGFHDLLFEYSRGQCRSHETASATRAAITRVLNHFVRTAYAASRLAGPYRRAVPIDVSWAESVTSELGTADEALDWLRSRKSVLLAGVRLAAEHGVDRCVTDLAWSLSDFLNRNRHCEDAVAAQRLAVAAAHRLGDRAALARAHRGAARGLTVLGHFDEAERDLRTALELFEALDDDGGRADVLSGFGFLCNQRGDHAKGLEVTMRAVELLRAGGHIPELIRELGNAGWFHAQLGDHEAAMAYCVESLELAERAGELSLRNAQWSSLGYVAFRQGDHRQAIEYYEHALALDRGSQQDRPHEAATLAYLAQVHEAIGDHDRARSYRRESRAILDELGLPVPPDQP